MEPETNATYLTKVVLCCLDKLSGPGSIYSIYSLNCHYNCDIVFVNNFTI